MQAYITTASMQATIVSKCRHRADSHLTLHHSLRLELQAPRSDSAVDARAAVLGQICRLLLRQSLWRPTSALLQAQTEHLQEGHIK